MFQLSQSSRNTAWAFDIRDTEAFIILIELHSTSINNFIQDTKIDSAKENLLSSWWMGNQCRWKNVEMKEIALIWRS